MIEPITCPRCRRSFGGEQAFRRGHRRMGRPRRETCRRVAELRRSYTLWQNGGGIWHVRGPATPGQLRLPIFGRGRPRRGDTIYKSRTKNGRTYLARPTPRRSPIAEILDAEAA